MLLIVVSLAIAKIKAKLYKYSFFSLYKCKYSSLLDFGLTKIKMIVGMTIKAIVKTMAQT